MKKNTTPKNQNQKLTDLEANREYADGQFITTDHGVKINNDHNSLKAG